MKLTKRGPYWWVDFRDPTGKRRRVSTGERTEAPGYIKAGEIVRASMTEHSTGNVGPGLTLAQALDRTFVEH